MTLLFYLFTTITVFTLCMCFWAQFVMYPKATKIGDREGQITARSVIHFGGMLFLITALLTCLIGSHL